MPREEILCEVTDDSQGTVESFCWPKEKLGLSLYVDVAQIDGPTKSLPSDDRMVSLSEVDRVLRALLSVWKATADLEPPKISWVSLFTSFAAQEAAAASAKAHASQPEPEYRPIYVTVPAVAPQLESLEIVLPRQELVPRAAPPARASALPLLRLVVGIAAAGLVAAAMWLFSRAKTTKVTKRRRRRKKKRTRLTR